MSEFPSGPLLVGGWCADGLTAVEVAHCIQKQGRTVGLLVLFDTVNPDYYLEARGLIHSFGRTLTTLKRIAQAAVERGVMRSLGVIAVSLFGVFRRVKTRVSETYSTPYVLDPCTCPVLLIRPPCGPLEQRDLGWGHACSNGLTVAEVPGDHSSIFRDPHVREVGRQLRVQIDAAMSTIAVRASQRIDQDTPLPFQTIAS
jgi:thioesterase domain-containing protein